MNNIVEDEVKSKTKEILQLIENLPPGIISCSVQFNNDEELNSSEIKIDRYKKQSIWSAFDAWDAWDAWDKS